MMLVRVYWLTCVLAVLALTVNATTIVVPTDEQLVAKTPVIVRATVIQSVPVERNGGIWTETKLQVGKAIKGDATGVITVREVGGIIGDRITKIFGAPEYREGERVLAFLAPTPRGDYQTVDLFVGKFTESSTLNGERLWIRDASLPSVTLLDSRFQPIAAANVQRDASAFEQFVEERVHGRAGLQNYGVENPVLAPATYHGGGGLVQSPDFTLISEPTIYRWFTFDSGGTAKWYSYGTQTGYTGGGVNEIQTAISPWDTCPSAVIRYSYAGSFSTQPAGLSRPNGVNEVLFNDPLQEITGSFNPATGGVVGQGGFNGVTNGGNWTSPFTADAQHTQGTFPAWNIVEGNLTIQDGVSPSAGISSTRLAEIIAHELGHTLGLGHSEDSTALMYYRVTGLGPSLRTDDQTAARWLYPDGGTQPPPPAIPAAPTGLAATSAADASVTLQWTDRSDNESGFGIYYAPSSGSWIKAGTVPAGQQSARLTGFTPGTWKFYVTAFNSAGESAPSNIVSVGVSLQLQAAFSVSPSLTGIAGSTVFTFSDTSTGSVISRGWNFGDGSTATAATVTHVFTAPGAYNVTLVVRDNAGSQSQLTKVVSVTAPTQSLMAEFSFSPVAPTVDDDITFTNLSTGANAWQWSFGDGTFATAQSPVKRYSTPGTYTVTLTAYSATNSQAISHSVTVTSSSPVFPPPSSEFRSIVPMAAQSSGVAGSQWRTELTLFNGGAEPSNISMTFIPGAGDSPRQQSLYLLPGQSRTYSNALPDLFGISSGSGAISVLASGTTATPQIKVTSRTFNQTPDGTYGQGVPDVGAAALQTTLYLTGIASNSDFRTNIGLVNSAGAPVTATLKLLDESGATVGTTALTMPAGNFRQDALVTDFPAVAGRSYTAMSLVVTTTAANALSVYASVVDNRTNDPVYYRATPSATSGPITIPLVGRVPGANNTYWRSDVTLFNPTTAWAYVTLTYRAASGSAPPRNVALAPLQTTVIQDLISWLGYSNSMGMLEASWSGAGIPIVTSKTYTTAANGGTYGQSTDAVESFGRSFDVTGLRSDTSFRTNAGFVNSGVAPMTVRVALLSPGGSVIAQTSLSLAARSQTQTSIASLFGIDPLSIGNFTLRASTDDAAALFVYGSIVDSISGDPVFFGGK